MAGGKRGKTFAYVLCNLLDLVSYRFVHLIAGEAIGVSVTATESLKVVEARDSSRVSDWTSRWHHARFERKVVRGRGITRLGWTVEEGCMRCGGVLGGEGCDCRFASQNC
jgi:hypothetical protein